MSLENTAIDAKTNLKIALKEGKNQCFIISTIINKIIDQALWEYLTIPGDTPADKLYNLITLPYGQGGLNTKIHEMDALLSLSSSTQRKFRTIVHQAKPGERNDLKPKINEDKVDAEFSYDKKSKKSSKAKKPSSSQLARDRAAQRAAEALPEINELLDNGLVAKDVAAKLGKVVKDPKNPTTDKEKKIVEQRKKAQEELAKIVAKPVPDEPEAREKLKKEIKSVIDEATGTKSPVKVSLKSDPQADAKTIARTTPNIDYLEQLKVSIDFEIEDLQKLSLVKSSSPANPSQTLEAA